MILQSRAISLQPLGDDEIASVVSKLQELISTYDLELDSRALERCAKHLLYVLQINGYINLTSITDLDEAISLHILDSLLLLLYLPAEARSLLDMGTGAGFPGVPLAASTDLDCYLIDSVGKKVNAVNAIIKELGLENAAAYHGRLETIAIDKRGCFDVVVARALSSLPVLLEYARPFLRKGGVFVVAKGTPVQDEMLSGERVASCLGFEHAGMYHYELPNDLGTRTVLTYRVVRPSSVRVPRAVGFARKHPLA